MNRILLSLTALAVVGASTTATALADDYSTNATGVSLRVGLFEPSEADTRYNAGSNWLAAGFDYRIKGSNFLHAPGGYFSVSLDYTGREEYRSVPLLLNYTFGRRLYGSVGAGVNFARFPEDTGQINTDDRFAYSGAIGFNFSNGDVPLFLEVRYFGSEMPRLAGTAVYVGARF